MVEEKKISYRKMVWKQFRKNRLSYFSFLLFCFLVFVSLLAPVIANQKPLMVKLNGETFFPAFSFSNNIEYKNENGIVTHLQTDITDWKHLPVESVVWALVPYSPGVSDELNASYSSPNDVQKFSDREKGNIEMPWRFHHLLGTDMHGADVLAGLIHGTRISLCIGIFSMLIASLIGIFLGSFAGFFGDHKLRTTRFQFWWNVLGIFLAFFYAFYFRSFTLSDAFKTSTLTMVSELIKSLLVFSIFILFFYFSGKLIKKVPVLRQDIFIPVDTYITKSIEVLISVPRLILIISIAAISKSSIVMVIMIFGFTSWTDIARFTRAEFLRIRNLEFVKAAEALGYSRLRIILRHALPGALASSMVAIAFGVGAVILGEAALSFLGVGVPQDVVTWGSLLFSGEQNFSAWWLVIFPGIAIFITVAACNLTGDGLRDALDPTLKK